MHSPHARAAARLLDRWRHVHILQMRECVKGRISNPGWSFILGASEDRQPPVGVVFLRTALSVADELLVTWIYSQRSPKWVKLDSFFALHRMPVMRRCLFVRPSVFKRLHCDKIEERSVQILYHMKVHSFSLVFWGEEWLVGCDPFYLKFWVACGAKSPIFSRYLLVVPQR